MLASCKARALECRRPADAGEAKERAGPFDPPTPDKSRLAAAATKQEPVCIGHYEERPLLAGWTTARIAGTAACATMQSTRGSLQTLALRRPLQADYTGTLNLQERPLLAFYTVL